MKKLIIYFLLLITAATIGCSKKLDVLPTQSIDEEDVFTSDAKVKAVLLGAYDAISSGYLLGGDLQLYSELLGANGEIRWVGTYNDPREIWRKAIPVNNDYVTTTWSDGYGVVNICNNILKHLDVVNEEDRERVEAEAKFLRGVILFELVELYAKPYSAGNVTTNPGLQLITEPTENGEMTEANYVARSTVAQTYDFILSDLIDARDHLPEENEVYANTYVASAFLARVYLQMADYENAGKEADRVIKSEYYELTKTYAAAFNNSVNSTEDIFAIQVSEKDGDNDMHLFWSTTDYGARDGDVEVQQEHFDLYEPDDARLAFFWDDLYSGKWKLNYKNLPVIRLAEMILVRAEASVRTGEDLGDGPQADLDEIRQRAGLLPKPATLENILYERRLELAHEGQRIHDIKRLHESVDGFAYNANELVFPIPLREINASNGVLDQNDGYGN